VIRRIQIDNFKSLDGFSLPPVETPPLANFTCLIGANGSGKTSVLQMFDYLAHFISTDVRHWIRSRDWSLFELRSRHIDTPRTASHMAFEVEADLEDVGIVKWSGNFSTLRKMESNDELIEINGKKILELSKGQLRIQVSEDDTSDVDFKALRFYGSCLALLDEKTLPSSIIRFKSAMQNVKSLELLAPGSMRRSSRPSDQIGWSGEYLAGFFSKLKPELRNAVQGKLREFFPFLVSLRTPSKEYGWRSLEARETKVSSVTAKHLSDGFLRVLAIVSQIEQQNTPDTVILLDEIENGLHPELIERLVMYLLQTKAQIIVTTHSPLILNYLSDEDAKKSMIFLYRNREGKTRSCRYFDLPSTSRKLGILGPGEVYVDTSVEKLAEEAEEIEQRVATNPIEVAQ
jgi:predicted ATPase